MRSRLSIKRLEEPGVWSGFWIALLIIGGILLGSYHPLFSAAVFLLLCFIVLRYETGGIVLLFLLLPFAGIFKLSPGSTSLFTYLELVYVIGIYAKRHFLLSRADLMLIVLAFCMFIAELLSGRIAVTNTIKVLLNLLLLEQFLNLFRAELQKKLYLWFAAGCVLSSVTSLYLSRFFPITRFLILNQVEQYGQYGARVVRFSGLNVDPNYYTVNIILALCLLIILYRQKKLTIGKACLLAAAMGVFAALTGSKSAFLMLGVTFVIFLAACWQRKKYWTFLISCAAAGGILAAIFSGKIPVFNGVLLRLSRSMKDLNSLTTGRFGVWLQYLRYFSENPVKLWFGQGVGIYVLNGRAAHNIYLDMLYELGILGSLCYFFCLAGIIRQRRARFRRRFLNYCGFLCVVLMYFFLSQLQGIDLPFHLFLCVSIWNTSYGASAKPLPAVGGICGRADHVY